MQPLISIVIPIYNVALYLERCLESVCSQTYQNLEIILVDDGSTDNSRHICDEYAARDNRINVIHKENGGLSEARNVGIDIFKGEYITFIDSDDFVHNGYIQRLYDLLIGGEADISVIGQQKFSSSNEIKEHEKDSNIKYFTGISAIADMWYQKNILTSAWGKLYNKSLFHEIRYPVGKLYEDLATTYRLFYLAKKIVYSSEILYYYYQRSSSIMYQKFTLDKMDRIAISLELLEWAKAYCPELREAATARFFLSNIQVLREIPITDGYQEQIQYIKNNVKKYRTQVIHDKNAKFMNRLIAYCSIFNIRLFQKMGCVYKRIFK